MKNLRQLAPADRDRYTWFLRAPFAAAFDRTRWWNGIPPPHEPDPVGAIYELARRHPLIGELRTQFHSRPWHAQELQLEINDSKAIRTYADVAKEDLRDHPDNVRALCLIGLKPWTKLSQCLKEFWFFSAKKLKGVDCRGPKEIGQPISTLALWELLEERKRKLVGNPRHVLTEVEEDMQLWKSILSNPFAATEIESVIKDVAVRAHREGHLLFAFAPNVPVDKAVHEFERLYRQSKKSIGQPMQRAKRRTKAAIPVEAKANKSDDDHMQWLKLIAEFEDDASAWHGLKSQLFARYRRAMDSLIFRPPWMGLPPELIA